MARRRKNSSEEGVSLDSLMDAMTNVVAVLILVLILVQADVTQKVQEFLEGLEPATPEEVAQSQKRLDELKKQRERQIELMEEDAPTPAAIEEEKRRLALLEKNIEDNQELLADLEELKKVEEKLRQEQAAEDEKTKTVQAEIAKLEAQLDATPVLEAQPPAVVNIPNSRPIPANAKVYRALVLDNRVHFIDTQTPLELFDEELQDNKNDWRLERVKRRGADLFIYDQEKLAAHFQNFDWKNSRQQVVKLETRPTSTAVHISITPDRENGGTPQEDLLKDSSLFHNILRRLGSDRDAVLFFQVDTGSFNTYLLARELADKAGVPAGWEIKGNGNYWLRIPDLQVNRLEEPPPPPDNPTPPKPGPPKLKPKLD
ncbi:MAG: hypothetical protein ACQKBY_11195 [Verrucomicrobiales bacterium]